MKTQSYVLALTTILGACSASTQAHAPVGARAELWLAASRTAQSITGDIRLSDSRLEMARKVVPLRAAGRLPAWSTIDGERVAARLFEVTRPAELTLLNGNRFGCDEPIRWIVTWRSQGGQDLNMSTWAGREKPRSEQSTSSGSDRAAQLCATYLYTRPTGQPTQATRK